MSEEYIEIDIGYLRSLWIDRNLERLEKYEVPM